MIQIRKDRFSFRKSSSFIAVFLLFLVTACGSKKTVTEDYLTGFRIGQLTSVSQALSLGKITGEEACNTVKNGIDAFNTKMELVKPEAFEGCVAGFEAGISGKAPKVGEVR